jgi:hypothetical protein
LLTGIDINAGGAGNINLCFLRVQAVGIVFPARVMNFNALSLTAAVKDVAPVVCTLVPRSSDPP